MLFLLAVSWEFDNICLYLIITTVETPRHDVDYDYRGNGTHSNPILLFVPGIRCYCGELSQSPEIVPYSWSTF